MSVKVNLKPLKRFIRAVSQDLRLSGSGPIRKAIKQWAVRYRSFVRERFDKFSKGGGDWKPLSKRTLAGRRKGKGVGLVAAILRDTGTLMAALQPTFTRKPGALERDIPFGVRVGFGGPARHKGGKATIADIASFHQEGKGRLPKREIIVDPSRGVLNAMASDMERALGKASA